MSKIIFVGDSITKGTDHGGVSARDTFAYQIGSSYGWPECINTGVSSDTSAKVLARLGRDVVSRSPDVCVIMVGANDWALSVPVGEYRSNLRSIFDALLLAGIRPVAMTSVLERGGTSDISKAQPYIQALEEICGEYGVPVIDVYREVAAAYLYLPGEEFRALFVDSIHLTKAGHRFVSDIARRCQFVKYLTPEKAQ